MNDSPPDQEGRDALKKLERRIGRLLREDDPAELARLGLRRVELLLEQAEDELAVDQLDRVIELLEELGLDPQLLAEAYARRLRLLSDDDSRAEQALADANRALDLAAALLPTDALAELRTELKIQRARAEVNLDREEALDTLREAIDDASHLEGPNAPLVRTQAHRELAIALGAADQLEPALEALEAAGAALSEHPEPPRSELALLRSTHSELLANADKLDEALEILESSGADDWVLVQRAATLDLAGRYEEAQAAANELVERLRERLDEDDLDACQQLAEVHLMQARRAAAEERAPLAAEALQLMEGFTYLPPRSRRLIAHALELHASALPDEEAAQQLDRRLHLLENLMREEATPRDVVEMIRTLMLLGDTLMRIGDPWNARRRYRAAINELRRLDPEHPAVVGILPLAHAATAQALGACGQWLAACQSCEEAITSIKPAMRLGTLADLSEVFLFRAIAKIHVGAAEDAVEGLGQDVARLVEAIQGVEKSDEDVPGSLLEVTVNAAVLQAEILVDHLDRVEEASGSYDQALTMCELAGVRPEIRGAIMGAKAAMLTERDRARDALPLLEQSVALFQANNEQGGGDLAFALVNLASTLNHLGAPRDALGKISQAQGLLSETDEESIEESRRQVIRSFLFHQRGEALLGVGHPLLAADEFTRSIDISRDLLDDDGDPRFEARQRLPLSLLRRARCWLLAGDHPREALVDLREARRRYNGLYEDEGRPEHRRRLREVEVLQRELEREKETG